MPRLSKRPEPQEDTADFGPWLRIGALFGFLVVCALGTLAFSMFAMGPVEDGEVYIAGLGWIELIDDEEVSLLKLVILFVCALGGVLAMVLQHVLRGDEPPLPPR